MNQIRKLHLYLGTLFAPLIIFFSLSGALQTFRFHEGTKASSYTPPAWIVTMAQIHRFQRDSRTDSFSYPLKYFVVLMAAGLIITTLLGIYMAFKFNRDARITCALLALGIIIPAVALLFH